MKKRAVVFGIIITLVTGFLWEPAFATPEDDEWVDTTGEWTEEAGEGEYQEEYVQDEYNEYTGEYSEGYDEGEALVEEGAWYFEIDEETGEEVWYYDDGYSDTSSETVENTEEEDEKEEEKPEPTTVPPIVADDGSVRKPVITSGSAAVYCKNTGELIFAKNADKRFSPYSITKLLTCLLAVQKLPMDQVVTVSAEAADQDGSTMDLQPGEEVTVEQLLYGTMILSGNDAAYSLAEAVSGDVDSFVELMNETVRNLGCKNTHFINPNGLTDDVSEQYTSANDFLEICKLAFANDTLREIAGANEYNMPETNLSDAYKMEGHNELLLDGKPGYIAGKTGYWEDDKATIAMDYVEGSLELIVVALGGDIDKRASDCDQLIEYAVANVEGLQVVKKGEVVANVRVKHGAETRTEAVTAGDSFIYIPKQASKELIQLVPVINEDITAPIKAGDVLGTYQIFLADEKIDEVPLIANKDIEEGWILSYVGISNRATLVMIGLIILLILLLIVRAVNQASVRRKKAQARRRSGRS